MMATVPVSLFGTNEDDRGTMVVGKVLDGDTDTGRRVIFLRREDPSPGMLQVEVSPEMADLITKFTAGEELGVGA